jgi:hypothetical protein
VTRALVYTLLGFAAVTVLGPVQDLLHMDMVVLDVPLIIVLYLAMADRGAVFGRLPPSRISLFRGGIDWTVGLTCFALGYITDVLGGGWKGIHCLTFVLLFLLSRLAARHVFLAGLVSTIVVAFVASLVASLFALLVRALAGVPPGLGTIGIVGAQAATTGILAPFVMRLLRAVDQRLAREPGERGTIT